MRLKALEMQGFKSFPDKTVLNFNQGITVIVGPNGSGKSNITDAVRWVLGEMSTKSIRGTKMEDVIFGGSDNRRPMGFAEVSLVIDNTQGTGKLDTEYNEVTVTRRYYRGGESEYLINGKQVRLRDIAELFMNTGVGKTGYSNIGQGKIAEIISQKSDERRSVFEEAAGISKYRYKKNEAERKLRDTEANLLRLTDILSELEARIGPLEKESNAAKKYLDLYEQKKAVDVSLWLYDAEAMRGKANETERAYMASKLSLESADGELASMEQRSEVLYQKASESQAGAEELNSKVSELINRRHSLESAGKVLENDILHTKSRIEQTETELKVRKASLQDSEERGRVLLVSLEEATERLKEIEQSILGLNARLEEQRQECDRAEEDILLFEDSEKLIDATLLDYKVRLSSLEGGHEAESGRSDGIKAELAEIEELVMSLGQAMKRTEEAISAYDKAINDERLSSEELSRQLSELNASEEAAREELSSVKLNIEAKQQRAEVLRRMDDLFEGYNYSVKNVMRAAQNGAVGGICGPVSKLISVKAEYTIAVETALGANIQNIVTENEESAKSAIAYLKKTGGGRATFYPVTSVKAQPSVISASDLSKHKGYIGMADALCDYDAKYSGVIGYMLGRTAVFDNIDSAAYTAKAFGYRIRIVTLDGQLVNAGGSFTGGSVKSDSGILTRSSEISALRDEITRLEIDKGSAELKIKELGGSIADISARIESVGSKISLLSTLRQSEQTQLEVTRSRMETEQARLASLSDDLSGIGAQREYYDSQCRALRESISEAEAELKAAKEKTNKAVLYRSSADDKLYELTAELGKKQIELTAQKKDVEALEGSISTESGTVLALEEQIKRSEELIASLSEKLNTASTTIESNKRSYGELDSDISELENERTRLISKNLEYEKQQSKLREELRDMTHRREVIFREYTKLEGQREQLATEHDRLAAKIWEDYELTYTQAAELGYPPVTEDTRASFGSRQNELKNKIRALGHVNVGAIEEYSEVKERYDFNREQIEDLTKARESLDGIIVRLEREMRTKFTQAFEDINRNFKLTFKELFGGGTAEILLTDPENVLTSGIEINVAPPGKIIKNLMLLSGGEQSFVAIALIFAILNVNPTPFCIFDEIESALDEVNVIRLAEYMKRYSEKTQFISITHRRGTMEASDMLYGITMPDRGISHVLSMNVNEVERKMGEKYN